MSLHVKQANQCVIKMADTVAGGLLVGIVTW